MRKEILFLAATLLVTTLMGCGGLSRGFGMLSGKQGSSSQLLAEPQYPNKNYKNDEERWEEERKLRIGDDFLQAMNQFAYETAAEAFDRDKQNNIYSPVSLYFAMSMAAAGAKGQTQQEILGLLGYEEEGKLAEDCKNAFRVFYQNQDSYQFQIASSLWIDEELSVKEEFINHVSTDYFAEIFKTYFSDKDAGKDMAAWVKEHTHGLLEPSISPSQEQVLSLMNAVYYYDEWLDQFDKKKTKEGTFTCEDGTTVTCDFMNRTMGSHFFLKGENYTVSSLSGKNGSMTILLPDKGEDIWQFLESADTLQAVLREETGEGMCGEVVWQVPKFSYGSSYALKEMLQNLGVLAAFSPEDADFSGISQQAAWIDSVIQQTHVGIDENGIEAASFTELAWAGAAMPTGRAEMILDRPFLYVIEEKGCPVFIGICGNPAEKE